MEVVPGWKGAGNRDVEVSLRYLIQLFSFLVRLRRRQVWTWRLLILDGRAGVRVRRRDVAAAPKADVICSQVGAFVNVNDFIGRESRALTDGGTFATGKYRFRYCRTPHLPHGWDAGVLFEETQRTLLCSDLFHQIGNVEPLTSADVVGRSHQAMKEYQAGILAEYVPHTPLTAQNLKKLADLKPKTLAIMHGSSFTGDCAQALDDLNVMLREVFGPQK